ncbi:MAG TPA: DUF927 domain-containing protein, partial [Kofleriaceae bacterium]|nr:DUF927 domain-containing protein [Kofleriaceae bacterium]
LCNFTARITEEVLLDDGEQQEEQYTIAMQCGVKARAVTVKCTDFEGDGAVARLTAALGYRARINPAAQVRRVTDAIKVLSADVVERTIYTHTGWNAGRFLYGNGYVDRDGWHESNVCQLPERLEQYRFTPPAASIGEALALFDQLLGLTRAIVIVPVLGALVLPPIASTIDTHPPLVHLYGTTGSQKSYGMCALMALWGGFTPMKPTDSWASTAKSSQKLGWHLMHAPMVLDDYKLVHVDKENVISILQNYGDGLARGRLTASSDLRRAYPIRAVLLSTGEDQPEGEAATYARMLSVSIGRGWIDLNVLTRVQTDAALLQILMLDYLRWLATTPARLKQHQERHHAIRVASINAITQRVEHAVNPGRIASNVAAIQLAWECFGAFLEERGHWPAERVRSWLDHCTGELLALALSQATMTTEERYSVIFLNTVRSLIASRKCALVDLGALDTDTKHATVIGGYDTEGVYLIRDAAYDAVAQQLKAAGRTVGFTQRALAKMLFDDGLMVSTTPPNLAVYKRRINNGAGAWCWHLAADALH